MSMENLQANVALKQNSVSASELQQLLEVVDREIADCHVTGISWDARFRHAYGATSQLCMVALRAKGFRPREWERAHELCIQSLRHTLGNAFAEIGDRLLRCSGIVEAMYERVGVVSAQDARELVETAKKLRIDVVAWLKSNHADLVPANI